VGLRARAAPGGPPRDTKPADRAGAGAVLRAAAVGAVMAWVVLLGPAVPAWAATTSATVAGPPPIGAMVPAETLPGFSPVAPGPTNGPLTASEFASQSSDPRTAAADFARLAAQPGFGATIRLWTDRTGPGHGSNDIAVLVFRIPGDTASRDFTDGLLTAFEDSAAARPFGVPSIAGARGYTIPVTSPLTATEQVVVFRTGHYVVMLQLASVTSSTNPTALGRAQAVTLSYQQYQLLHLLDPRGSAPTAGPVTTRPAPSPPAAPRVASSGTTGRAVAIGLAVVVLAALGWLLWFLVRRRRAAPDATPPVPAPPEPADPWGPTGVLASFGAIDPRSHDRDSEQVHDAHRPARAVPALVPAVVDDGDGAESSDGASEAEGVGRSGAPGVGAVVRS